MRLVIDMQGAQTASRFRGIGRYTMNLVKEMVRQRGEHEIILALNAAYADTIEPIRAAFADLLPFEAIRVFELAGPVGGHDVSNDARRRAAETVREAFLCHLQPDVILISSLFDEFGGEAVTSVHSFQNNVPTAVILYDLIPLIHRRFYLTDPQLERWYFGKLNHLKRADMLLSISASSGREAKEYLNWPEHSVTNISTACDPHFRPIALSDAQRVHLKNAYGINRPFVLGAGNTDHRKNLDGLVRAFAQLPAEIRAAHALVLVGREVAAEKPKILNRAKQAGLLEGELVFTGYVPDDELVLLYNGSVLLVFPSWHEGFGLPVLEAMACAKAAIAANSSSLPEVVGRQDALFAPRDDAGMAAKMAEVLGNTKFRQELERHGLEQAKRFSWGTSAKRAWVALQALHQKMPQHRAVVPLAMRPRLAFVSPLPPEKTVISDYVAELLPELARHYEITVIVQQEHVEESWVQANAPIRDVAWFRVHSQQFDRVLYQIGNSDKHVPMLALLAEIPGVVTLHDFYLSGPLTWAMEQHPEYRHAWTKELYRSHGWKAVLDRYETPYAARSVGAWPCNLTVLQQSLGVIVHSNYSRRLAERFYGDGITGDLALIPHLRQAVQKRDKTTARNDLRLSPDDFIVCRFWVPGASTLNQRLLEAWLASPLALDQRSRLVFVGENQRGEYDYCLLQTIAESPSNDRIMVTGWTDVETYRTWLAAADVGVQLRTFSRGETSAAVLDCMNYGLTTIVNAHGSLADLPSNAVWMLPDCFTDEALGDALTALWKDPDKRCAIGAAAREHVLRHHDPRACADQCVEAIESAYRKAASGLAGVQQAVVQNIPALSPQDLPRFAQTLACNLPPHPRRQQFLMDVSELVQRDARSGIQRVTRALLQEIVFNPPAGWAVEPVYATTDRPGYRYARRFMSRFLGLPADWAEDAPVEAWQGDVFLGLDLQHHVVLAQEETLQSWKLRGICVYFVVYDLLPVTMPEVFPVGTRDLHQQWLSTITRFDGALCISRAVAEELFGWLQTFGPKRERPLSIDWFRLGSDVENSTPSKGVPGDAKQVFQEFRSRATFLMVGTIEPRKGYLQALQAFSQLWELGVDVNLVIVGKEGWKPLAEDLRRDIPQTVHALRSHTELGKRLFWLEAISDEYLEQVYAHATCLISASLDEGFGLPLIEAASHGLPLLARDIPVFREVTADQAYFFKNSQDPEVIAKAVRKWLALFEKGEHLRSDAMPRQSWQECAREMLDAIFGRRQSYKNWLPDGVPRYWGADPRLQTQLGKKVGKTISTSGEDEGFLIFGPYIKLEPGKYDLIIQCHVNNWGSGARFDATINQGNKQLVEKMLDYNKIGERVESCCFEIEETINDFEVRIWTGKRCLFTLKSVEIHKRTNKLCLAYFVSSSHFDRLENSLNKQNELGVVLTHDRVLISDCSDEFIADYPLISKFFNGCIVATNPWIESEIYGRQFAFSKFRNSAIDYADSKNYDYLCFCDSDTIFTVGEIEIGDDIDFAIPDVYWQKNENESVRQSLININNEGNPFSQGNSWFVLSRKIIKNAKFNEAIFGYGYEDIEFWAKVESKFGKARHINLTIIHSFHPGTEKKINTELFDRNKFIYESCLLLAQSSFNAINSRFVLPIAKDDGRLFFSGPNVYLDEC